MATKKISDLQLRSSFDDTVNLPGDDASQTWRVTGAQIQAYIQAQIADLMKASYDLYNLGLAASVSGNALTISLKQLDGSSAPSTASPVRIGFRGTTAANGDSSLISATGATSVVVSSGSTLGMSSAVQGFIYIYAINNGGTIELGVSRQRLDEGSLQTSVAEGGAGAADSAAVLYSTSARTSKAVRLIGRIAITEATAGTWATAPIELAVWPFKFQKDFFSVQHSTADKTTTSSTFASLSGNTLTFTPTKSGKYRIYCGGTGYVSSESQRAEGEIVATAGAPTVICSQTVNFSSAKHDPFYVFTIDDLVAGVAYTYDFKAKITGGATFTLSSSTLTNGTYLVAEEVE